MRKNLVDRDSESPPPYEEWAYPTGSPFASEDLYQTRRNSGYAPVQYNLAGQNPQKVYEVLIDASNQPSEMFCRMADALFFHLDQHCDRFRGTQRLEPAKLAWLEVALGQETEQSIAVERHLPSLYDAASIPYTFDHTQTPVLDRRGHLHLCVFEVRADPAYAQQKWNKTLYVLKLCDPLINLPFPTPIPCSVFPSGSDFILNQVYTNWQIKIALRISRQTKEAMATQQRGDFPAANNNTQHTLTGQQAVPIARRSASQTKQQFDELQRIQTAGSRVLQPDSSQTLPARGLELARMAGKEVDMEGNSGLHKSPTVQAQQAVPIARLAAFQAVQQFERLHNPPAESGMTQSSELPQTTQAASGRAPGMSPGEQGRNTGMHKSPMTQAQQAVSIARQAAFQTVQQSERLQKIQPAKSG